MIEDQHKFGHQVDPTYPQIDDDEPDSSDPPSGRALLWVFVAFVAIAAINAGDNAAGCGRSADNSQGEMP